VAQTPAGLFFAQGFQVTPPARPGRKANLLLSLPARVCVDGRRRLGPVGQTAEERARSVHLRPNERVPIFREETAEATDADAANPTRRGNFSRMLEPRKRVMTKAGVLQSAAGVTKEERPFFLFRKARASPTHRMWIASSKLRPTNNPESQS
jgi:hypothetical protein